MSQVIEVKGHGEVEFPDDMSRDEIVEVLRQRFSGQQPPQEEGLSMDRISRTAQQTMQRLQGQMPRNIAETGAESLARQAFSNVLNTFPALGEVTAQGSALAETGAQALLGRTDLPFGEQFQQNLERGRQQFPAASFRAGPSATAEDVLAAIATPARRVRSALDRRASGDRSPLTRDEASAQTQEDFQQAQFEQDARRAELLQQPGGMTGRALGDATTLLAGRAPRAGRLASERSAQRMALEQAAVARNQLRIPEATREQTRDVLTDKIIPAISRTGGATQRGLGRVAEAGFEGALIAAMNDDDPVTSAGLAAGVQLGSSASLHLLSSPVKRLLPTIGAAWALHGIYQQFTPGERNFFEQMDFAFDKVSAGVALGIMAGAAGGGRIRGPVAERMPEIMDAVTSIPRGTGQSMLRQLAVSEEDGNSLPVSVLRKMGNDPEFFTDDQLRSLSRAMMSEKDNAFLKEVERLSRESRSFQERMKDL